MKYNVWSKRSLFQATHNHKEILIAAFDREQARITASGVFHCPIEDIKVGHALKPIYISERQGS